MPIQLWQKKRKTNL